MTAEQARHLHEMLWRFRREPGTEWLSGIQVIEAVGETLGKGILMSAIPAIAAWLKDANREAAESAGKGVGIECLLERIRRGRNRAVHEGTGAKRLTDDVNEALRVIEEGMVRTAMTRSLHYYMVPDIIWAKSCESLRSVRNTMLRYELSALPIELDGKYYWLEASEIAEHVVAGKSLKEKCSEAAIRRTPAKRLDEGDDASKAAEEISSGKPGVLVTRGQGADVWVIGIVTAFDLMYAAPK